MTEATGKALSAMVADLDKMATGGLTAEELDKVKAQDRPDLVETYESVGGVSRRLASLADARARARLRRPGEPAAPGGAQGRARRPRAGVSPKGAIIVVVGPAAAVTPQLAEAGLGQPELWDAEGQPVKAAPVKKVGPARK